MAVLLLALLFTGVHWSITHNVVEVCYTIDAPGGRSQVYWDSGNGFSEEHNRIVRDSAEPGSSRLCFSSVRMRDLTALRIDPVDYPGDFWISDIKMTYLDVLLPFRFVNRFQLSPDDALLEGMASLPGEARYESFGHDPMMTWAVPMKRVGGLPLVMISFCILGSVMLFIVFLTRRQGRSPTVLVLLSPLLLVYPFYILFAIFSDVFGSFIRYTDYALWLALGLTLLVVVTNRIPEWSVRKSIASAVAISIMFVAGFDIVFRLGIIEKPAFMLSGNQVYHWRLGQPPGQNMRHSSMRYFDDFDMIRDTLDSQAAFLSDLATGYYVSAATSLQATNVHLHHDNDAGTYRKVLEDICGAERGDTRKILNDLYGENQKRRAADRRAIRYLLVNRDEINQNVVGNCLQRNHAQILRVFGDRLHPLVIGKYIDVYEINFDR